MARWKSVRWHSSALVTVALGTLVLSGCSIGTPLCDRAAVLAKKANLAAAAELYVEAQEQKEGTCADDGLAAVTKSHSEAFVDVAQSAAAEKAGDIDKATTLYRKALAVDAGNAAAAAGLDRVAPPPSAPPHGMSSAQPPGAGPPAVERPTQRTTASPSTGQSWTSRPWYLVGFLLIAVLLAGGAGFLALRARRVWLDLQKRVHQIEGKLQQLERKDDAQGADLTRQEIELRTVAASIKQVDQKQTECHQEAREALRVALRNERLRVDRLFNWLVGAQPEPSRENCRYFTRRPSDASGDQLSSGDPPPSDEITRVVDVRIFWVTTAANTREDWQGRIVLQCVTSATPAGRLGLPVPELQDRESGEGHDAEDRLLEAFDEAAAKKLMDSTWERSTKVWVTPVCDGVASIADGLSGLQHQWHDLVLGEPTRSLSEQMNLEAPSGDVLASVAAELALPGDPSFKAIKRMVQFTGIFIGVVGGQPLLANACLKSLVHDLVAEAISKAIGDVIRNAVEPTRTREHDLEVPEVRRQHTRQIEELKREIAHQHQKELKREELKERIQERTINHDRDGYRMQEHIDDDRDRYRMQEHIDDDRDRYRGQEHTIDDDRDIDQ